ncbi:MAG: hypothetical protein ACTSW1_12180 [Candidatus Hodarchaeales archaeon]
MGSWLSDTFSKASVSKDLMLKKLSVGKIALTEEQVNAIGSFVVTIVADVIDNFTSVHGVLVLNSLKFLLTCYNLYLAVKGFDPTFNWGGLEVHVWIFKIVNFLVKIMSGFFKIEEPNEQGTQTVMKVITTATYVLLVLLASGLYIIEIGRLTFTHGPQTTIATLALFTFNQLLDTLAVMLGLAVDPFVKKIVATISGINLVLDITAGLITIFING